MGRWYNANEQMFYFEKMVKLLSGEDGRIVRDENRTGQEIRKGDTLRSEEIRIKIINMIQLISSPNVLIRCYNFIKHLYLNN